MTIRNLDFYPDYEGKTFITSMFCSDKNLISLEGSPKEINGDCDISKNKLTSLKYCPEKVNGNFYCADNNLESLEYRPKLIKGIFNCRNNKIKNIKNEVIKHRIVAKNYTTDEGFFTFENIKIEFDKYTKELSKIEQLKKEKKKQRLNNQDFGLNI